MGKTTNIRRLRQRSRQKFKKQMVRITFISILRLVRFQAGFGTGILRMETHQDHLIATNWPLRITHKEV